MNIQEFYDRAKTNYSDIYQHIETLKRYADECPHITEMGVGNIVSTWAFLAANPKTYVGIDLVKRPIETAEQLAKDAGIDFTFIQTDSLADSLNIDETDLLFIDTLHIYRQLKAELLKHGDKARKYIIMHDTTAFGEHDETSWADHNEEARIEYDKRMGPKTEKDGLWLAVTEYLQENTKWKLIERFTHNNGLTILGRA